MIVPTIDLRPTLLPVRHQGRRPSCLAFACSTAHEHKICSGEHLCVEYLHYQAVTRTPGRNPSAGTTMFAAAAALAETGQPAEAAWPYCALQVSPWAPPDITSAFYRATLRPSRLHFDEVVVALDKNQPVVLGLVITDAFYRPDSQGLVADRNPDIERGGHAVLAVGHGAFPAGSRALLIRNSWGTGWGLGGYGWLPQPYVERQLRESAVLGPVLNYRTNVRNNRIGAPTILNRSCVVAVGAAFSKA